MAVLRRPELLFTHIANYVELLKSELSAAGVSLAVRVASGVVALIALLLALSLTGVAVMLGFLQGAFHWVLIAVPAAAWLLLLICVVLAMRSTVKEKVDDVKNEVAADFSMLRLVKEAKNE